MTCHLGALAPSATAVVTITVTVRPLIGSIENTVIVAGNDPDPDPTNNTAAASTVVDAYRLYLPLAIRE